jgi:dienelactone hydrolase
LRVVVAIAVAACAALARPVAADPPSDATLVEYATGRKGFFYRPDGVGPFPVVVWNHGSEPRPGWQAELAHFYVSRGWAFLLPHRRGHGQSPGDHIGKERDGAKVVALLDEHNVDVVAAIAWVKKQPAIDPARVVVSGCSFGGIQTLIVAAKGRRDPRSGAVRAGGDHVAADPGATRPADTRSDLTTTTTVATILQSSRSITNHGISISLRAALMMSLSCSSRSDRSETVSCGVLQRFASQFIIQWMPNLSTSMPNRAPQN